MNRELSVFFKPLSQISFDKSNTRPVCFFKNKFLSLDDAKGLLQRSNPLPSVDMIFISKEKEEIWFVEFKSSSQQNLNSKSEKIKLKRKIFGSLILLNELCCEKACEIIKYEKYYFVVYNKEFISYENEVIEYFEETSDRSIEFTLEDLKPSFIKDVLTENCEQFTRLFSKRFNIDFIHE